MHFIEIVQLSCYLDVEKDDVVLCWFAFHSESDKKTNAKKTPNCTEISIQMNT